MLSRRLIPLTLVAIGVAASLSAIGVLVLAPAARALPPAGTDFLGVSAEVSVVSRGGQETISFTGTATLERQDPRMEGELEVVDLELVSLSLSGQSLTGPVTVSESPDFVSSGQIRSRQPPPDQFPASSFFDVFMDVVVPISGSRTPPRLHNEVPLRLVPMSEGSEAAIDAWPPLGVKYAAEPEAPAGSHCDPERSPPGPGGLPLVGPPPTLSPLPAEVCVTAVTLVLSEVPTPTVTFTPCPPELCPPTPTPTRRPPTPTRTPGPTSTPTPTSTPPGPENPSFSVAPGGPSGFHPADLLGLASVPPVTVSGNDNFASAWEIPSLPFAGIQTTIGSTTEAGEPLNPNNCITVAPGTMGATVWYRFTAAGSGTVGADTAGSDFDTVLAAYTGSALNALTPVACDDDSGPGLQSMINFSVTAGTSYYLQVGGFAGGAGGLSLNVSMGGGAGLPPVTAVRVPCAALGLTTDGCDSGADGDQDDIDALSFGSDSTVGNRPIAFSVAPGSVGRLGTEVAQQVACSPPQPQADEFSSPLDGTNTLVLDGDGLDGDCPTAPGLGLVEEPSSDDLDALNQQPPSSVDVDGDGSLDQPVFFSLAVGSPTLGALGRSAADILWTIGFSPGTYASASTLGLQVGDDIDGLCLVDGGELARYEPGTDSISFSLAAGSPTLAAIGASAADVLGPGPVVLTAAGSLGLRGDDDLDAMKCFAGAGPTPTATPPRTPTSTPTPPGQAGDVNKDGTVSSIDAALVLQYIAGLLPSINQNADANRDGTVNAIDAALILQYVAGLLDRLPP